MQHPTFKYHPNAYTLDLFTPAAEMEEDARCQCCGKQSDIYYSTMIYSVEDVDCLCPECIADGSAAAKFDGSFIQDAEEVGNEEKSNELYLRTPGLITWQGEYWLAHCDDYCAYIGDVGIRELEKRGILEEVLEDYAKQDGYDVEVVRAHLTAGGSLAGYLFQCLHCGRYRIWVDAD